MKTMKNNWMTITLVTVVALLAIGAGAEVTAVSAEVALNTRSLSSLAAAEDQNLDTRSFTEDLSDQYWLDTRKIIETIIVIR